MAATADADWMTVTEAGRYIGVCRTVAYDMVSAGTMPVVDVNKGRTARTRLRVYRPDLDKALRDGGTLPTRPRRRAA